MSARDLPTRGTATRADLARALVAEGHPPSASRAMVNTIVDVIAETLIAGEDVKLRGFGRFSLADKGSRPVRNPQTGEPMVLDARRTVTFRPSDGLRGRVSAALCSDGDRRQV